MNTANALRTARLIPFRLAMRRPLETARTVHLHRDGWLLELVAGDERGYGEVVHVPGFATEYANEAGEALRDLAPFLARVDPRDVATRAALVRRIPHDRPAARAALETALLDLSTRLEGRRLIDALEGASTRPGEVLDVAIAGLISCTDVDEARAQARDLVGEGFGTLKLKLRGPERLAPDLARLAAVRDEVGPDVALRVDANGSFDEAQALAAGARLAELGVDMFEQPVPADDLEALARVTAALAVPVAADESATPAERCRTVIATRAAARVVLKPSLLGGPHMTAALARLAVEAGFGVVVTSALESAVGLTAALHVARALGGEGLAAGLATASLLAEDLADGPRVMGGRMRLPAQPGLGTQPDPERVERARSGPDVQLLGGP